MNCSSALKYYVLFILVQRCIYIVTVKVVLCGFVDLTHICLFRTMKVTWFTFVIYHQKFSENAHFNTCTSDAEDKSPVFIVNVQRVSIWQLT